MKAFTKIAALTLAFCVAGSSVVMAGSIMTFKNNRGTGRYKSRSTASYSPSRERPAAKSVKSQNKENSDTEKTASRTDTLSK